MRTLKLLVLAPFALVAACGGGDANTVPATPSTPDLSAVEAGAPSTDMTAPAPAASDTPAPTPPPADTAAATPPPADTATTAAADSKPDAGAPPAKKGGKGGGKKPGKK